MNRRKIPIRIRSDKKGEYYNPMFREARLKRDYAVEELAKVIGVSHSYICHVEHLRHYPLYEKRKKFAEVLERDEIFLFPEWIRYLTEERESWAKDDIMEWEISVGINSSKLSLDSLREKDFPLQKPILEQNGFYYEFDKNPLELLEEALENLSPREKKIIEIRYSLNGNRTLSLRKLRREIKMNGQSVSHQTVSDIQKSALEKIKKYLKQHIIP